MSDEPEREWWLCPNEPRCPHAAVLHDLDEPGGVELCTVEGCLCGYVVA